MPHTLFPIIFFFHTYILILVTVIDNVYYLYIRNLSDEFIRIDVIEVYINNNVYKVNHIKQAFEG